MPTPYYADERVTIWHGNALALPIPDESVDLVVTSPPYWSLRSYLDQGEHYDGQIGSEATPGEFVDALIAATVEMVRVLKPSGSIFVNLGDKYGPDKSLMLLPERYRIRCTDDLGLIARAVILWAKPNGLPESCTDRVRRSHEDWIHLTKEPRYFSAVDEIREEYSPSSESRFRYGFNTAMRGMLGSPDEARAQANQPTGPSPLGKLPSSVWEIPTQPLRVPPELGIDHFAAFPMEWPRRIIRGWSPSGICVECGEGRRPVTDKTPTSTQRSTESRSSMSKGTAAIRGVDRKPLETIVRTYDVTVTGYACACDAPTAPTRPAVVLDPFGGTGTTTLVAKSLGRTGWHVDLSADYCRLAQWRVTDPGELARAMQVEKPPPAPEDMDSLLDLLEGGAA